MKLPFTGGCVCGAVRYACSAEPIMMVKCHCRDCQRVSGGPYTPAVLVPYNAFKVIQGTIRHFATPSVGGGHNKRGFCPKCGSRLTGGEDPEKGIIGIHASSLDEPDWFWATADMFVADAQPWDIMDPAIPKFDQY